MTWLRASEHAAVQVDCGIKAGDDVQWILSIHDTMTTLFPWKPQDFNADEEGVHDEVGRCWTGLFLGFTERPVIMGPAVLNSTLSGIRARDGEVLHKGRILENCKTYNSAAKLGTKLLNQELNPRGLQ